MSEYKIVRKHLLEPSKLHALLDSLEYQIEQMMYDGWRPQAGLFSSGEFIMQVMVRNLDNQ